MAGLAGMLLLVESAHSGMVIAKGDPSVEELEFRADAGERNRVSMVRSGQAVTIVDRGAAIRLASGSQVCIQPASDKVICPESDSFLAVSVSLGDGNDRLQLRGTLAYGIVEGGTGDDHLVGGPAGGELGWLAGGPGNDRLVGRGTSTDVLEGGTGRDRLTGRGATLNGGPGRDDLGGRGATVAYTATRRTRPIVVTLDGLPNDGPWGERDYVRPEVTGVEVSGARPDDRIVGNRKPNKLLMDSGTVIGGGGADTMFGAGVFYGGDGDDHITADGRGRFYGGPGNDAIEKAESSEGDPGDPALLSGGAGNDTISSADYWCEPWGRAVGLLGLDPGDCESFPVKDHVACGAGRDRSTADRIDIVQRDCERRRRWTARTSN